MKTCTQCGTEYPESTQYFRAERRAHGPQLRAQCRECDRKYTSAYQHKYMPSKGQAYWAVKDAISNGTLERQPCEICGAEPAEGHHDDYSKPLEVRWLCHHHHQLVHHNAVAELGVVERERDEALSRIAALEADAKSARNGIDHWRDLFDRTYADLVAMKKNWKEDRAKLAAAEAALAKMNARHCPHCAMAYVDCPRAIELLDGGGPMDIECCSEWTPKEDEA